MQNIYSLSQLNNEISFVIKDAFPDTYWLVAEISDVRENASNGHCYLEFIEKNEKTGNIIAKAKGNIWKQTFWMLKPYFEQATNRPFASGIRILVSVSVEFHELYGYSLTVHDIDPTYTLGDLQQKKQAIIRQLEEEGVLNLNKELDFPLIPQRIAIISSATAAGYEDFLEHVNNNDFGYIFYTKLFPAVMQGEQTETSIINALDKIYSHKEHFDVVVVIRGGGATSELASFDSYLLAANCAQFPLPIIVGIGHERDETVLDSVAYKRVKTPTAAATFLIGKMEETGNELFETQQNIVSATNQLLTKESFGLNNIANKIPMLCFSAIEKQQTNLNLYKIKLQSEVTQLLISTANDLKEKESYLKLSSPEYILKKGYSITTFNGKTIRNKKDINSGDEIITKLNEGTIRSVVK